MAESSLETQIDCFLEQFKRNASKAMEERSNTTIITRINHSTSSYLDGESPRAELLSPSEEIEMVVNTTINQDSLSLNDVEELLSAKYAIISGGKSKDGCPIITFPDNNNFHLLNDLEYQRLMLYLTSVPTLQEADLGFQLIIDRRKDRWNSIKTVLLKISAYFPGLINAVYVLRPESFLQKALSEVSNKLFKDEFKFRMILLSTIDELHEYFDMSQLTTDLGGKLMYSHNDWMQQRIELETFSLITQQVSNALDKFTKTIEEIELPNNVDLTQQLLNRHAIDYSELKEEILSAAKHGETLLTKIKSKSLQELTSTSPSATSDDLKNLLTPTHYNCDNVMGNVFTIERLLVQLEETERKFDDYWEKHSAKLRHCLKLRRFEQDFRELQINFDAHLKVLTEMNQIIDEFTTIAHIDYFLNDIISFEQLILVDVEKSEQVISCGNSLMQNKNFYQMQCIEPKCCELIRLRDNLMENLHRRKELLIKSKDIMVNVEKANEWCRIGIDLMKLHEIDKGTITKLIAQQYIKQIEEFMKTRTTFDIHLNMISKDDETISSEIHLMVAQLVPKVDELSEMCKKRISTMQMLICAPPTALPKQPICGAPHPNRVVFKKISNNKSDSSNNKQIESDTNPTTENDEINKVKTGHVLTELMETEKVYVSELQSVIIGYKLETKSEEMQHLVTAELVEKIDVIFGNLEEICAFHGNVFLKDLENCISSIDLVALCFVQRRDSFFTLYSYYCQNIPRSEQLRETLVDSNMFFQTCQRKLGHKLPLAAYLLKPVQRLTKYQLLLKDLLKYSDERKCCKELEQALDCMLVVLKCVNDSMHQISITGFPVDLAQQGDLLLQGSFSVWVENKKELILRLKPTRRHIFLYQKAILFCKSTSKTTTRTHNKATYQFKHYLKMSQIGLTESVKGDERKFEVWLQGRQEVHTIQATSIEQKQSWVNEIKRVLLNQLEELKGEKIKQYTALIHKPLGQTASWEKEKSLPNNSVISNHRSMSCDIESHPNHNTTDDNQHLEFEGDNWSTDCSNSDDEEQQNNSAIPSGRYVALADYCAIGHSEVNMREGDIVELLKIGCAGWWFIKVIGSSVEGWAPAAYLENLQRRTSRSSNKSQEKLNDH